MGQNPELRTLFYRLAWLSQACVVPVFVFDGLARPAMKRGHLVRKLRHWMTPFFQNMITAFGFYFYEVSCCQLVLYDRPLKNTQAPGEAEAELAYLNYIGLIDAIVTDDNDAFVFGAKRVIRNR